jgi:hypothetical protein
MLRFLAFVSISIDHFFFCEPDGHLEWNLYNWLPIFQSAIPLRSHSATRIAILAVGFAGDAHQIYHVLLVQFTIGFGLRQRDEEWCV